MHLIFPECVISCVDIIDGLVMGVVYDHTHQWLLGSCVKFRKTAVVVMKDSI